MDLSFGKSSANTMGRSFRGMDGTEARWEWVENDWQGTKMGIASIDFFLRNFSSKERGFKHKVM